MNSNRLAALLITGLLIAAQRVATAAAALPVVIDAPLQVAIPVAPMLFRANGAAHLAYEIEITNVSESGWTLRQLDVRDEKGINRLSVASDKVAELLWHKGGPRRSEHPPSVVVAPGESVIAYLWVDLDGKSAAPTQLRHHFSVQREGEAPRVIDAPTTVVRGSAREISSPLRGTDWVAANGPANSSQHRRGYFVIGGTAYIGQRFAIDWVRIGADSRTFHGDGKDNRSYLCYGAEVLAVADGVVSEIKDGIQENVPQQPPAVPITLETVAGNHINLDLGGGVFAMYAHLQPGSLRVKVGDRVQRGQVIALLGNTGNSTEPHLHFQLMDRNSPLASEGVPYVLPQFTVTKQIRGSLGESITIEPLPAPQKHRGELPLDMQLVNLN